MRVLLDCSYNKQRNYLTLPPGLYVPRELHRVCFRFRVTERGWQGMKDMFDERRATSKKNVEYFEYSETEGGPFCCVIGDDSEYRVLQEQIRTLEWVREKIENANSESIYGAGRNFCVDDDVTMDATVDGGSESDIDDAGVACATGAGEEEL